MKIKRVWLWLILVVSVFGAETSPWLLSPEEYQQVHVRKPLLLSRLAQWEGKSSIQVLAIATTAFDSANYDKALEIYRKNRTAFPHLEGQIVERMARCYLELNQLDSARMLLLSDASIKKNRAWWESIDRLVVETILADSSFSITARIDSLDRRIKIKPSENYSLWMQYQKALLVEKSGESEKSQKLWENLLKTKGYQNIAQQKLSVLPFARLNTNTLKSLVVAQCKNEQNIPCIFGVDTLILRGVDAETKVNLLALKAQALKGIDKVVDATAIYRYLLDSVEMRPSWMQNLIRLERGQNHKDEANRLDSLFRDKYPFSSENANNLWVKALEYEQENKPDSAIIYYNLLCDERFGASPKHQWAPFRRAYLEMRRGQYALAISLWDSVTSKDPSAMANAAELFFQAESYLRLGDSANAVKKYLATHQYFPLSWYGHRARQRLQETKLFPPKDIPQIITFQASDSQTVEWLRQRQSRNHRTELEIAESLQEVELLYLIGFNEEAKQMLSKFNNIYARRADYLYMLGQMHRRLGNYGESYRMARLFLEVADRRWMDKMPRPLAEFLYPLPEIWRKDVEGYITPPVDLFFLFGVMRQESIFIPTITSPAGAKGLMQFMPQTGQTIARLEKINGYREELLYNPVMSMRLGNRYLGDLLKEYNGSHIYTLANYNAGPTPAKRWLKANANLDLDQQVEAVSYWETRDYIKKVMGNYWTYQAIYGN